MKTNRNLGAGLIWGALIGSMLVGTSKILLDSKKRKKLQKNIACKYEEYKDVIDTLIDGFPHHTSSWNKQTADWSNKAQLLLQTVRDELTTLSDPEQRKTLIIGGILGSLLGIGAAALMAASKGTEQEGTNWKKVLQHSFEILNNHTEEFDEEKSSDFKKPLKEVLDLAVAGIRLWQGMSKK